MKNIRVLVANRPRLMRELLLATISDQPDIEIVGEIQDEAEIQTAVERTQPDFLIVALDQSNRMPTVCGTILQQHPDMKVIAIASERNSSMCYCTSLSIHSSPIEASEEGLLSALRGETESAGEPR